MISQETIDRILDRLDIVEIISEHIQLKRVGRSFKAHCPFHNEKTPSFIVSPDKQIYHCFGCGAGGNIIGFLMKYENMAFPEALELLAARAGVELPKYQKAKEESDTLVSRLYEINNLAASFYQTELRKEENKAAFEYIKKRGINTKILSEFRLGYAPDAWDTFRKYCEEKKLPIDLVRKAGLSIPSEKGKGDYDRFRNRVVFPIFNERSHIVAFGARVMDDSLPKYINSPETPIYSKSNILYGLNFSKKGIRDKGYAVIVEGYLDVIIPFQAGITNIVATSGTALTPLQVAMLKRYTDTTVIIFDADQAGEAASLRGLDIMIAGGMKVKIATLPQGDDPDSFVRKNGGEVFERIVGTAKDLFDYKLDLLVKRIGIHDIGAISDEMLPTISKIQNAVVQSGYLRRLAERLGVHEASLRHEMAKVKPDYTYHHAQEKRKEASSINCKSSELHLLGLAISSRSMFDEIKDKLTLSKLHDKNIIRVMEIIQTFHEASGEEISPSKLLSRLEEDDQAKALVLEAISRTDMIKDRQNALNDCILCILKEDRNEKLKELSIKLKEAQSSNNDKEIRRLVERIDKIHKEKVV